MGVPLLMPRYRRPARGSRRIGMPQRKQEQLAQHVALPLGCVNAGALRRRLAAAVAGRRFIAALAAATFFTCAPAQASPQQDYILYCMGCHGAQAEGVPGKVPPLAHALGRYMRTPEGRNYILRVPGAANSVLSDAQLAAVLNWLAQTFNGDELTRDRKSVV